MHVHARRVAPPRWTHTGDGKTDKYPSRNRPSFAVYLLRKQIMGLYRAGHLPSPPHAAGLDAVVDHDVEVDAAFPDPLLDIIWLPGLGSRTRSIGKTVAHPKIHVREQNLPCLLDVACAWPRIIHEKAR